MTGQPSHFGSSSFSAASRSFIFGERLPGAEMPEKSPLTSAIKNRRAERRELLREHLQGDRLAGAGRPGDQSVAVREHQQQAELFGSGFGERGADSVHAGSS